MKASRVLILALATLFASDAYAFCGFYVAGADSEIFNNATMVVMLRDGTTTVLSMQNDYQGPAENFAVVVPVPAVLGEDNVRTLSRDVFDRVDTLAAPRLVEYWEQDPCRSGTIGLGNLGTIGHGGGGGGSGYGRGAGRLQVRVEAEFTVGEYESGVTDVSSTGLDRSPPATKECFESALRRWTFPEPDNGQRVEISYPFSLRLVSGGGVGPYNSFVLTRLHYRYGQEDLVFREADGIVGGREMRDAEGELEQAASPAPLNNFQGRYTIRHAWTGAVECENPRRGFWGANPETGSRELQAASRPANAPRGGVTLSAFVPGGLQGLAAGSAAQPELLADPTTESAEQVTQVAATGTGGCGRCSVGSQQPVLAVLVFRVRVRASVCVATSTRLTGQIHSDRNLVQHAAD